MAISYLKIGDSGVTQSGGFASSSASNAIWSSSYRSQAGENGSPAKYTYFTFSSLTAGQTYSLAITWVRDANRNTQTPWRVQDGDSSASVIASAVSGAVSGTVNQELAPCGPIDGSGVSSLPVPWQYLGSYTPSGTNLTVRVGTGPVETVGQDFSVADGARCQNVTEDCVCVPQTGTVTSTAGWIPRAPNGTSDSIATGPVDMVIDQNLTAGNSSSTPAIQLPYGTTLTIADGMKVVCKGDVVMYSIAAGLTKTTRVSGYFPIKVGQGLTGGAILEFDGASTAWVVKASQNDLINAIPKIQGVSGNPAIVRTVNGSNYAYFSDGGFANLSGQIDASYCDFSYLGSTVPAIKAVGNRTGASFVLQNCNFTNCGDGSGSTGVVNVSVPGSTTTLTIQDCNFTSITTPSYPIALVSAGAGASGTWNIKRNYFEGFVNYNHTSAYANLSLEDNVYLRQFTYNNATSSPPLDRGNFCFKTQNPDSTGKEMVPSGVNYADSYVFSDYSESSPVKGNPHQFLPSGTNFTATGCIHDYWGDATEDIGDAVQGNSTNVAVKNAIILKSVHASSPCSSGALWKFQTFSSTMTIEHCTIYCSNSNLSGYQTGHGTGAGTLNAGVSTKSNIFWSDSDGGSNLTYIRNSTTYSTTPDFISASGITNNCVYGSFGTYNTNTVNAVTGQSFYGLDRMVFGAVAPAAPLTVDPQFVDPTRNFLKWATNVMGFTGTNIQKRDLAFAALKADKTLVRTSLIPYVRAGFAPTNVALQGTAHDSGDIGAVAYQAPVTARRADSRNFPRGTGRGTNRGTC